MKRTRMDYATLGSGEYAEVGADTYVVVPCTKCGKFYHHPDQIAPGKEEHSGSRTWVCSCGFRLNLMLWHSNRLSDDLTCTYAPDCPVVARLVRLVAMEGDQHERTCSTDL